MFRYKKRCKNFNKEIKKGYIGYISDLLRPELKFWNLMLLFDIHKAFVEIVLIENFQMMDPELSFVTW